jgi:hypothetical protein
VECHVGMYCENKNYMENYRNLNRTLHDSSTNQHDCDVDDELY